jgi:hypothetical protein
MKPPEVISAGVGEAKQRARPSAAWQPEGSHPLRPREHGRSDQLQLEIPSVIRRGNKRHLFYDGCADRSISHYHRAIGMATLHLPLTIPR